MLPSLKSLKITLPLATATTATIATASLVSFKKEDKKLNSDNKDQILEDIEKPVEDFKEKLMLYSEEGDGEDATVENLEAAQKLLEKAEKDGIHKGNLDVSDLIPKLEETGKGLENNEKKDAYDDKDNVKFTVPPEAQENKELSGANEIDSALDQDNKEPVSGPDSSDVSADDDPQQPSLDVATMPSGDGQDEEISPKTESDEKDSEQRDDKVLDVKDDNSPEGGTQSLDSSQDTEATEKTNLLENGSSEDPNGSLESKHEAQSTQNDVSPNSSIGTEDGIQNEHGTEKISQKQIEEMLKLEEETVGALAGLRKLLI